MPTSTGPGKTVVVADDTASVRDRFRAAFDGSGHEVVAVEDADALLAWLALAPCAPDLLLLDLRLPGLQGAALVRAIRAVHKRLRVLVFSGTVADADEVRALAALGVAGYLNESIAPHQIVPAVTPQLFPDNFDRRTGPRVVLGIPIQYRFGQTIAAALTLNLGHGGLAVRTTSPSHEGSRMTVSFRVPDVGEVEAECRVIWSDPRVGMGLQFEAVDSAAQALIDRFVERSVHSRTP
jgi:CheY-like chemotaxis protein